MKTEGVIFMQDVVKFTFLVSLGTMFSLSGFPSNLILTNSQLLGQTSHSIPIAVPFLLISPDARAAGLGNAGVASSSDANDIHWNSSKMAFNDGDIVVAANDVPLDFKSRTPNTALGNIAFLKKFNNNDSIGDDAIGMSLQYIDFNDSSVNRKPFMFTAWAADIAYSKRFLKNFSAGVALRYIYSDTVPGVSASSLAGDVSCYYTNTFHVGSRQMHWSAGTNISNLGSKMTYKDSSSEFLPANLCLGTAISTNINQYNSITFLFDLNKLLVPTPPIRDSLGHITAGMDNNISVPKGIVQSFYDAPGGLPQELREITISTGLEYLYDKQFALRTRFFYENPTQGSRQFITFGCGVVYNAFSMDFSYLIPTQQRSPLDHLLQFSLLFNINAIRHLYDLKNNYKTDL